MSVACRVFRRCISNNSASVTRVHRSVAARTYPTVLVLPDGATINFRYHEPRKIIKLPLDLTQVSEEERRARVERRKPKQQVTIEEEIVDTFNVNKHLLRFKKGAK